MSACDNKDGAFAPFCSPVDGAQFTPGQTVNITWDPTFFGDTSTLVQIQAEFSPVGGDATSVSGEVGFTSDDLAAGTGFFEWDVPQAALENGSGAVDAQISIAVASTGTETQTDGPLVHVVAAGGSGSGGGPNVAAIVVPVVIGVLALAFVGWYMYMRRRNPGWSFRGVLGLGGSGGGYGTRKSKGERTGAEGGVGSQGVRMGDMGMRPGDGRNVFREEIRRQEGARM